MSRVICSDSFDRANGSLGTLDNALGGSGTFTWTIGGAGGSNSGTITVVSNEAKAGSLSTPSCSATTDLGVDDYTLTLRMPAASGANSGLVFRYQDQNNHYFTRLNNAGGATWECGRYVSGSVHSFTSIQTISGNTNDSVIVTVIGSRIKIQVHRSSGTGLDLFNDTDASFSTGSKVGLFSRQANDRFDDFVASAVGGWYVGSITMSHRTVITTDTRITEAGDTRITEAGDTRITE